MSEEKAEKTSEYEEDLKYALMRQELLNALRKDLIGPLPIDNEDGFSRNPDDQYVTGKLFSKEEENDPASPSTPNTCGLFCYVKDADVYSLKALPRWAAYGKENDLYFRRDYSEEIIFSADNENCWIPLKEDSDVLFKFSRTPVGGGYQMVSACLLNNRSNEEDLNIYQVGIELCAVSGEEVFVPENVCRHYAYKEDDLYHSHPVYARGFNCAATWQAPVRGDREANAVSVDTAFIPDYEINSISSSISGIKLNAHDFYTDDKGDCLARLNDLASDYENWIGQLNASGDSPDPEKGRRKTVESCQEAHDRIQEGIQRLETDEDAWHAFQFMNQVMYLQNAISRYSERGEEETDVDFQAFLDIHDENLKAYTWRPFQIAFILLNMESITDPLNKEEREIVDLLYFPTGGGKTEAYLGLIAFTIGYRRLTRDRVRDYEKDYDKDGGVTVFLRYTLRLLTKQQRDRITKMILAAELIRGAETGSDGSHVFGEEPFSIGFWVGDKNTPNSFSEYGIKPRNGKRIGRGKFQEKIHKQLAECPFCGRKFDIGEMDQEEVYPGFADHYKMKFNNENRAAGLAIYCTNPNCYFTEDKGREIPVYLIDDQVYEKCPTVVIATVDKFARLSSTGDTRALFGKRKSCRGSHRKDYYPPELIIQDELHLITGSLGSMYGCYETAVEEMCTIRCDKGEIKPKYVVCTATLENARNQIRGLYGRSEVRQFPPQGADVADSYFSREIALPSSPYEKYKTCEDGKVDLDRSMENEGEKPFRQYVGVCGSGRLSEQEVVARVYAVLFQKFNDLYNNEKYEKFHQTPDRYVDPYFTLVGFFTTIRELGTMVWEMVDKDKIPAMIEDVFKYLPKSLVSREIREDKQEEVTSRVDTEDLPEILENLGLDLSDPDSYEVVLATNMIAVGLDIDRLGLMVMTGAPKSNSEYIQASSRVGRKYPGLIITVYNQNKERDISYFENFTGFHAQMYHYIEGTTVSPFSEGTRARILHAVIVDLLRMQNEDLNGEEDAVNILALSDEGLQACKDLICDRAGQAAGEEVREEVSKEFDDFIEDWKSLAKSSDNKLYYNLSSKNYQSKLSGHHLLRYYSADRIDENDKSRPTLASMRDVEHEIKLFLRR